MKIGIEAQRIFRTKKHGMDFVALHLIRELQKLDNENQYFIFVNEGEDTNCLQETANFKIITFPGIYPVWEQIKLPKMAGKYGLDLLHCTSNTAPVSCPVPLVVTIHDIIYFETNPLTAKGYSAYQKFGNLYRRLVVKNILPRITRIYTVSHFEMQHMQRYIHLPAERIKVVYNGVSEHFRKIDDEQEHQRIVQKFNLPEHFCLFLGNTDPKKNTPRTLQAFAQACHRGMHDMYLVVGDFDRKLIREYLQEVGLEQYQDRFLTIGYIPNEELPVIMNLAEVFLYTSLRESFGIPLLEGMACGTPVISSNTSSMPEIAGGAAVLINPESAQEMTNALLELLQNETRRKELTALGIKQVEKFTWAHTAREYWQDYKRILS